MFYLIIILVIFVLLWYFGINKIQKQNEMLSELDDEEDE